jgi:hypothetical protein
MIQPVSVEGREIQRLVFDRIAPAIEGESIEAAVLSLLTMAVLVMKPDVTIERLQEIVLQTSETLILSMEDFNPENAH